jgi:hypothetical protein
MLWLMKTNSSISTATSRSFYSADDGGRFLRRAVPKRRVGAQRPRHAATVSLGERRSVAVIDVNSHSNAALTQF